MDTFFKNITAFFGRLSVGQRVAIGTVVLGTIAAMVGLTVWFQQANYTLLCGNLPETAASQVVEILQNEEIEYRLKDGGTAIYVPNELVYDLRHRFAREGISFAYPTQTTFTAAPDGHMVMPYAPPAPAASPTVRGHRTF